MDIDFVVAIGGLRKVNLGSLHSAFGDEMAGVLGGMFRGADGGVVRDRLVDSMVSMLRVLFFRVDLEIGHESVI